MLILSLLAATPIIVSAQDKDTVQKKLEQLEADIKAQKAQKASLEARSVAALTEADRLTLDLVKAAKNIRLNEDNAMRLERRIAALETSEATKKAMLNGKQDELLELLSALERLSKRPAALALLQPSKALDTARSAALMGTIVPEINAKAGALRKELASLAIIQQDLSAERFQLKNTLQRLTDNQLKIGSLVQRRKAEARKAQKDARNIARELQRIAAQATSLKELIDKLEQSAAKRAQSKARLAKPDRQRPIIRPRARPFFEQKGSLPYPVIGRVIRKFGAKEPVGVARGIQIEARPGAQVVAPYDGKIVFAGQFREYGQLLIIEHGGGYHSLMAGFGDLYGVVGQWVLTGEPVGAMASAKKVVPLYLEMRHSGRAINPEPWLKRQMAASK